MENEHYIERLECKIADLDEEIDKILDSLDFLATKMDDLEKKLDVFIEEAYEKFAFQCDLDSLKD